MEWISEILGRTLFSIGGATITVSQVVLIPLVSRVMGGRQVRRLV